MNYPYRLVFFPMYSSSTNLNGCSSYNIGRAMSNFLTKKCGVFLYWVFPVVNDKRLGNWRYIEEPTIWDNPRIARCDIPMHQYRFFENAFMTEPFWQFFNQPRGPYTYDAFFTERPMISPLLMKLGGYHIKSNTMQVPIIVKDVYVLNPSDSDFSDIDLILQSIGYLCSNTIFACSNDKERAIDTASSYLKRSDLMSISKNSVVISPGTDCDELDAAMIGLKKHQKITLNFSGRLTSAGRYQDVLETYDYVYKSGADVQVQLVTLSAKSGTCFGIPKEMLRYADITYACPHTEFLKKMPKAHIFMTASPRHSYPQGLMEQLYAGLIGLFPNLSWVHALLPPKYPFIYDSLGDAREMLAWVANNYEEAKSMIDWVPEWLRATYDTSVCFGKINEYTVDLIKRSRAETTISPHLMALADTVANYYQDVITYDDMCSGVKTFSDFGVNIREGRNIPRGMINKFFFREALRRVGYTDSCQLDVPHMIKSEVT